MNVLFHGLSIPRIIVNKGNYQETQFFDD